MAPKRFQIGKLLLEKKMLTQEQLDKAIIHQTITGKKLGKVLIELGLLKEDQLQQLLSQQLELPLVELKDYPWDLSAVQLIPEMVARRLQCIVLDDKDDSYLVGMSDPQDLLAFDEISVLLKKPIQIAIVRERELENIFNIIYR